MRPTWCPSSEVWGREASRTDGPEFESSFRLHSYLQRIVHPQHLPLPGDTGHSHSPQDCHGDATDCVFQRRQ